ncbi:hypothetical protein [Corynebacterium lactis]|uniref:Surface anchored protein n=1 Tax=Corynebacterium lactis RW2-5 TaxID=1408189 RepID=A0A0K2GXL3_9CORY|nr:hypothetical protein [Corynebacterium lactis]ALA66525.1 surface anchored protein [Corynebacterium lactis RW2-5]
MTSSQTARSRLIGRTAAIAVACGASLSVGLATGPGADMAAAAPVAGQTGVPNMERSVGTDVLTIQLTQGNPDDDGMAPSGAIAGVKIHLKRLSGIDPKNSADMARVEKATLEQNQGWPTDAHLWQVTDAEGKTRFEGLADGIYLVTSTAPGEGYREINSFLVAVPFHTVATNSNPVAGVIVAKTHTPGKPPVTPPTPPDVPEVPGVPPTKPGTPPSAPPSVPTTPNNSDSPPVPEQPDPHEKAPSEKTPKGPLAVTGAQVIGLVVVAAVLIGAGFVLIAGNRRKQEKKAGS